jgi:uncharacterized protein YkwD
MRILSWVGGVLVVVAISAGVVSAVRVHPQPVPSLSASRPITNGAPYTSPAVADPTAPRRFPRLSPEPSPSQVAPPAPPANEGPIPPPQPQPAIAIGSTQQRLINQDRSGAGLGALSWNSCLASVAQSNASRMANQGYISHAGGANADLSCGLGHQAGENVGYWSGGVNDSQLNTMFMNSPGHRANIMGPYRYIATAWVTASNGAAYIAVEFG